MVTSNQSAPVVVPDLVKTLTGAEDLVAVLSGMKPADPAASGKDSNSSPNVLAMLLALARQFEKAQKAAAAEPATPPLTPVNAALGETVGNMLNGKKTVLGTIVMLATTLIPALTPIIPGLAPVAVAVKAAEPIVLPLASALTGWGVLGKIDKWFATRTS